MDEELPEEENLYILQQEETNSDLQSKSFPPITQQMPKCDKDVHIIAKPSTSSSTIRREESPRKKKLQQRIVRLQGRVKTLDERNRRLQKKVKILIVRKKKAEKEKLKDHEILRQLGCKFFSPIFARLLSAQIDAQIKSKHGRQYSSEFKQFAL
ncbi:uncharacterized protein LOC112455095, partial [Temnothorax curvispinosus]|uniref:Uncharacterized protein LOC112455095 n=1 Tax=Temnothorax curvispinosus TaxID=300111 RepID=A0A6J1PRX6_9HYME